MIWRLDPRCELSVLAALPGPGEEHEDLGCGLQGPASRLVRRALDPLRKRITKLGEAASLKRTEELVKWIESQPDYAALCTSKTVFGRRQLRRDVLYAPTTQLRPALLQVRHATTGYDYRALQVPVAKSDWAATHDLCSLMSLGASDKVLRKVAASAHMESLLDDLLEAGWLGEQPDDGAPTDAQKEGIWFVGHNTAIVGSKKARLIVDPWFRPWREGDPQDYKPLRPVDLGPVDAIAITHSHGDHFHLGSLLAFPRDTPILVPYVERESILATDLERRLREIGFTRVQAMKWWTSTRVGDLEVSALPFYGEQASSIALVDPELRNVGNTWLVRTPTVSAAFLADTGRDPAGSMQGVAVTARERWGKTDLVFGGMRGFSLCPLFLPFTSLDAMFVNAPLEVLAVKQRLMNDADDLLATAEVFGASQVVPYADGGAPWYWRESMGPSYEGYPSYDGERESPNADVEDPASAPFPERLEEAAMKRSGGKPLVESLLLRPGDLVRWSQGRPRVGRVEGFAWPYRD
jgi:L-ascorbate metabolism protein UlaG (beta-lactamase superfamily)